MSRYAFVGALLIGFSASSFAPVTLAAERYSLPQDEEIQYVGFCRIVIEYYESKRSTWKDEDLLPVAMSYAVVGRPDEAEVLFPKYLAIHPENSVALRGLGLLLLNSERYREALPYLEGGGKAGRS